MTDDEQLLRLYVEERSDSAFAALVRRHIDLVYAAALRMVGGDTHLAQDVAQLVFTDLARKAPGLPRPVVLAGWLHRHTIFTASKAVRTERRRKSREQIAMEMTELDDQGEPAWEEIAPHLDASLNELSPHDRDAIILRFLKRQDLRTVGLALGLSEDAAQKRVGRALEKLRGVLRTRGVALTGATLATALAADAVTLAPASLAISVTAASLAAAKGTATTLTLLKIMVTTKLKTGIIGALLVAGLTAPLVIQHQADVKLRERDETIRLRDDQLAQLAAEKDRLSTLLDQATRSLALRQPEPPPRANSPGAGPTDDKAQGSLYARIKDNAPTLTPQQLESYLKENRRNAASLLAGFRTSGDPVLLEEAMQKYPNDPQVAFEAAFKKDVTPEERRKWLDAFQKSAPKNALADYLSAQEHFKNGQPDQALQDLTTASGKQQFQDYTLPRIQDDEEAYLSAGYSVAEAKTISSMQLLLPQLAGMKELSQNLIDLAVSYRQAGDASSAQETLQMVMNLGQRYSVDSPGEPEVSRLVGMAIEAKALKVMDPTAPYGDSAQSVGDRLQELAQQRADLNQRAEQMETLQESMSDQDWISYKDRWRNFGEEAAVRWLIDKHGPQ